MAVIYEKHYQHPTLEEEMKELGEYQKELEKGPDCKPEPAKTFNEFYQEMMENRTLILLPEKMEKVNKFIKLAIEASEINELDTKISEKDSHIEVNYYFDSAGDMAFLIPVFWLADSVSFFTGIYGFDITISLDYYTHAVFNKGRLLHPYDLKDKICPM